MIVGILITSSSLFFFPPLSLSRGFSPIVERGGTNPPQIGPSLGFRLIDIRGLRLVLFRFTRQHIVITSVDGRMERRTDGRTD